MATPPPAPLVSFVDREITRDEQTIDAALREPAGEVSAFFRPHELLHDARDMTAVLGALREVRAKRARLSELTEMLACDDVRGWAYRLLQIEAFAYSDRDGWNESWCPVDLRPVPQEG